MNEACSHVASVSRRVRITASVSAAYERLDSIIKQKKAERVSPGEAGREVVHVQVGTSINEELQVQS